MITNIIKNRSNIFWMKVGVLSVLFVVIFIFTYTNMKSMVRGVKISADLVNDKTTSISEISGVAKNATYLALNGREIFIAKDGTFKENLALPEGYSVITIDAKDNFGKENKKTIEVYTVNQKSVAVNQQLGSRN